MRILLYPLISLLLVLAACTGQQPAQETPASQPAQFRTIATVKEVMDSIVDPSADFIWDSVSVLVSAKGVEETAPRTDEEWLEVRRRALALMEATNLLLIPRAVAHPGEKAEAPEIDLSPEQIQTMIDQDRATWEKKVQTLYDATIPSLNAIDSKDKDALLAAGDAIDRACEGCHLIYWYPNDKVAQEEYAAQEKQQ